MPRLEDEEGRVWPCPRASEFAENPDILATVSQLGDTRPALVVGFAAETDDVLAYATAKRDRKGCDWIVANDVSPATGIMGGEENAVTVITASGAEEWPRVPKDEVARRLALRIAGALGRADGAEASGGSIWARMKGQAMVPVIRVLRETGPMPRVALRLRDGGCRRSGYPRQPAARSAGRRVPSGARQARRRADRPAGGDPRGATRSDPRPRSGLALRHGISLPNTPGTIDSDYRGPLGVLLINYGGEPFVIGHGDRIAQMIVAPVGWKARPNAPTPWATRRGARAASVRRVGHDSGSGMTAGWT